MNTYQIQCVIDSDVELRQSIRGVFPSDELSRVHFKMGMGQYRYQTVTRKTLDSVLLQ